MILLYNRQERMNYSNINTIYNLITITYYYSSVQSFYFIILSLIKDNIIVLKLMSSENTSIVSLLVRNNRQPFKSQSDTRQSSCQLETKEDSK